MSEQVTLPPYELAAGAPWLDGARAQVAAALAAGRLGHALLIQGPAGIGKLALAEFIGRLALCERPGSAPCGACAACHLHAAGNHPDLHRVGLVDEKKQVAVEDVRQLIEKLTLRSYRGGRKVAIIDPADLMSTSGANSLLKTLEEPSADALLILTVARPDRLPATIASRCQRILLRAPPAPVALAWLAAIDPAVDWRGPLALAAGAPLAALRLGRADATAFEKDMGALPGILNRPDADVVGLAERFKEDRPADRLRWIENWVTDRIRRGLLPAAADHSPATPGLPAAVRRRHIQGLYAILDELRTAQAALTRGSANVAQLWERVLGLVAAELASLRAARTR